MTEVQRVGLLVAVVGVLLLTAGVGTVAADAPDCSTVSYNGDGTETNPYEVSNVDQLQCINEQGLDANYTQVSDIDASGTSAWNGGDGFDPIGYVTLGSRFTGTFDGSDHTISRLTIDRGSTGDVGLFGAVGSGSRLENVSLKNVDINGNDEVGGLVGRNGLFGTVENSYATGNVSGDEGGVGGLVGFNADGTIRESYATGDVTGGEGGAGGLVGFNAGTVSGSYATGSVSGDGQVGGLVGFGASVLGGSTVERSYAIGDVSGNDTVGGLVGDNLGTVRDSYATGDVNGDGQVGGLVGENDGSGSIRDGTVTESYWDTETTGQPTSDGNGTGLTTSEMTGSAAPSNMGGFDFTSTWKMVTNPDDYPILAWQSGGGGTDPSIDKDSFKIEPFPVKKGEAPEVSVDVKNADNVQIKVNGEKAEMNPAGGTTWKKVIDPSEFGSVDNEIGERVELEVVAGSDTLSKIENAYPRTRLPKDPNTIPPTEQLHYYTFKKVQDVPVVLAKFKNQDRADMIRFQLDTPEQVTQWERAREYDINTYMGSGRGSSGSIGFNLEYYNNSGNLHTVKKDSYYDSRSNWDCGFTNDAKNEASLNADMFVATHPGSGGGAVVSNCGVFASTRAYMDMGTQTTRDEYGVWLEELSHLYLNLGDLYEDDRTTAVNGGLGSTDPLNYLTGLMASGVNNHGDDKYGDIANNRLPQPYSVISRTELNDIGFTSQVDPDWPWSDINQVDIDTDSDGKTVDIKNVNNIGLDDTVPILNTNKSAGGLLDNNGTIKYLFEGDVYEPDVRGYRIFKSGVLGKSLDTAVTVDTSVDGEQSLVKDGLFVEFSVRGTKPAKVTVNYNSKSNAKSASLISSVTSDADVLGLADLPNNVTLPDLDLRAVDSQGRVTGVTENGNFVNDIPGAEASGDSTGVEWIVVPDDADVEFEVSSDDVQKFIDETGVSEENVTAKYSTSVTSYGSDTEVIEQNGEPVVTDTTTETVTENESIDPGETENAVEDTVIAGFGITPRQPSVGDTVTFEGAFSTNLDGSIQSYSWDLGDGTTATGETVTHSYSSSGEYTVTLTVTGDNGETDTETKTVTVEGGTSANFDVGIADTNSPVEEGDVLTVEAIVTNTGGASGTQTIELDAGSLGTALRSSVSLDVGEQEFLPLSIPTESGDAGTYTATVSSDDDTASASVTIEDGGGPPSAPDCSNVNYNGDGTDTNPYEVGNVDQLQCIEDQGLDANYVQVSDIDASSTSSWNGGDGFDPLGEFNGTFDGQDNDITGLTIDRGGTEDVGLFGKVGDAGTVINVGVVNADVTGDSLVGVLVGNNYGTVKRSYSKGSATAEGIVGGLVGRNRGTVRESYTSGSVSAEGTSGFAAGGLAGVNQLKVIDSHSSSSVDGDTGAGGLIGAQETGNLGIGQVITKNSYAVGSVTSGNSTGGLIGIKGFIYAGGTVADSYWDKQATGQSSSDGGTGLTTSEMTGSAATNNMIGFDFTSTWETVTNPDDYPILAFQNEDGEDDTFTDPLPGFNSPPQNTGDLDPNLYEDVDGDGDGTDASGAVLLWSELVQNPQAFDDLTQEQIDALDWNGDGQLTPADAVILWSEKVQA